MNRSDGKGGAAGIGMSAVCTGDRKQSNLEAKFLQIRRVRSDNLVVLSCFYVHPVHLLGNCDFFAYRT